MEKAEAEAGEAEAEGAEAMAGEPELAGLVCVEYPGVAESPDRVVETLGGLETLAQVLEEPNRRLELRFRPEDVFSKPACGERQPGASFLVRVKRRRLRPGRESAGKPAELHQTTIEGAVTDCFKFGSLADFQYLCMAKEDGDAGHKSIYPEVYFGSSGLVTTDWLDSPAPLFLPPAAFSRMDLPQDYQYRCLRPL
jgi:general transcription factor 3C polypeptide 5 (transcription factor C subunit 1)